MRRAQPLALAALAAAVLVSPLQGQQSSTPPAVFDSSRGDDAATPSTPAAPAAPAQNPTEPQPLPYAPDEFPQWLHDLRRGEIITIGAFPIVYLFTQLGYNIYRYSVHGGDSQYAPLGNPNQVPYSTSETIGVLLGAASLSVVVATADYLIGRARARKAERGAHGGKP